MHTDVTVLAHAKDRRPSFIQEWYDALNREAPVLREAQRLAEADESLCSDRFTLFRMARQNFDSTLHFYDRVGAVTAARNEMLRVVHDILVPGAT